MFPTKASAHFCFHQSLCICILSKFKMKLLLLTLLISCLLLLAPQSGCQAATTWCKTRCRHEVEKAESVSGQKPDYRIWLKYKYTEFFASSCRPCLQHYCELIDQHYGTPTAEEVCNVEIGK